MAERDALLFELAQVQDLRYGLIPMTQLAGPLIQVISYAQTTRIQRVTRCHLPRR
jgi:hypothetical protein